MLQDYKIQQNGKYLQNLTGYDNTPKSINVAIMIVQKSTQLNGHDPRYTNSDTL